MILNARVHPWQCEFCSVILCQSTSLIMPILLSDVTYQSTSLIMPIVFRAKTGSLPPDGVDSFFLFFDFLGLLGQGLPATGKDFSWNHHNVNISNKPPELSFQSNWICWKCMIIRHSNMYSVKLHCQLRNGLTLNWSRLRFQVNLCHWLGSPLPPSLPQTCYIPVP